MNSHHQEPTTTTTTTTTGLIISKTQILQSFLATSANNIHLPPNLQQLASSLSNNNNNNQSSIPYRSLRSIWSASDPTTRPDLSTLLSGSHFVLPSPQPRQKSEELKARLRKFEEAAERKAYKELVKDITPRRDESEPFSSYKDQIGFGLHVALTMFTGYLVGYYTFRALFGHDNVVMHAAGGILGLVIGMLVETLLFIIRASNQDRDPKTSFIASKIKKNQ